MSKLSMGIILVIVIFILAAVLYVLFAQVGPCAYLQKGYKNIETCKCENFSTCGNIPSKYVYDSNCLGALKVCPNELIQNKMPAVYPSINSDYYILNGERREISEFDAEWVKANCTVEIKVVN